MLLAIGSGNISLSQIINILPENQPQLDNAQVSKKIKSPTSGIEVLGVGDLLTKIAKCCNPIPGDSIIGFITRSTGVTVHIKSCINILNETRGTLSVDIAPNTGVSAYYGGQKKIETVNTGVTISGVCTATSFVGDG